jgi:hypothetical protein
MQCDVRVAEDNSPFLEGTKCILLCGEYAMHKYIPQSRNNTLNEMRGTLFYLNGIPTIASYFPQDCCEFGHKNFEAEFNALSLSNKDDGDDEEDEKRHSNTSRSNYAFWLRADVRKCKRILKDGVPSPVPQPVYLDCPSSKDVIDGLRSVTNGHLYFDIETDYEEQNLQCFSFSFDGRTVYNVPVLDYNYKPYYQHLPQIIRSLAVAIKANTLVCHNGACFDYIVLGYKYHIPVYKVYDTMVAQHRCFPQVEKSLGHCTSLHTWQPFHKDQDSQGYRTKDQMMARLAYCGKDVFTMYLIHQEIERYAKTIPGLGDSIKTAMEQIVPYVTTTLQGIRTNDSLIVKMKKENDRLMSQYLRIINILIGKAGMDMVQDCVKGKAGAFPGSNKQCVEYFHNILGYPVVHRSKENQKGERNPSLAKQAMYRLRLTNDNPVIDFCNAYRGTKIETTTPLGFIPWKDDNGQIVNRNNYQWSDEYAQ